MDFRSFLGGSKPEESLKTIGFSMVFVNFHKINVFEKNAKKTLIWESFSEAKTTKNREKMILKNMYFCNFHFFAFFRDFLRFWLDFGRPWALQKFKKIRKNQKKSIFSRVPF